MNETLWGVVIGGGITFLGSFISQIISFYRENFRVRDERKYERYLSLRDKVEELYKLFDDYCIILLKYHSSVVSIYDDRMETFNYDELDKAMGAEKDNGRTRKELNLLVDLYFPEISGSFNDLVTVVKKIREYDVIDRKNPAIKDKHSKLEILDRLGKSKNELIKIVGDDIKKLGEKFRKEDTYKD